MANVKQLGYVGLGVSDLAGWERFATEVLGLQVAERESDGTLFIRHDEYHHRFILREDGSDDLALLGWEVENESEMDAVSNALSAKHVAVERGTRAEAEARRVLGLIKFKDPNGIASEVYYGPLMHDERFVSPRPISGFVAGALGLGHVVVVTGKLDESVRFYREALGMRLSDYMTPNEMRAKRIGIDSSMAFLHCNGRHHSIAFGSGNWPKRLNHIMVEAQTLADVGATLDVCAERAVPLLSTLGQHSNDLMTSFYMRAPAGFGIEFGFGGRIVDDSTWHVQTHRRGSLWGHRPVAK
jgi:2,3-dihydroxybiphenyl 1,2-dioxygenase